MSIQVLVFGSQLYPILFKFVSKLRGQGLAILLNSKIYIIVLKGFSFAKFLDNTNTLRPSFKATVKA